MRLNRSNLLLLLILTAIVIWSTPKLIQLCRPYVSYWLKHTPMCVAENIGLLNPRRARYISEIESTIDILYCTPSKPPKLIEGPMSHDLIVISGMGGVVQRISTVGRLIWQSQMWAPRGLDLQDGKLLVGEGKTLNIVSLDTGEKLQTFKLDKEILGARLRGNTLFAVMAAEGNGSVRRYELLNNEARLINSASVVAAYPRGVDVDEFNIYIADTFGNRILHLDLATLIVKDEVASYFPNSVQVMGGNLIVTEEHSNVVSEFKLNPLKRSKILAGCPTHLLSNQFKKGVVKNIEEEIACDRTKSVAALYSPNDAAILDGQLYIADADNHRVIQISNGKVTAELTGFNEPVNLLAIPH